LLLAKNLLSLLKNLSKMNPLQTFIEQAGKTIVARTDNNDAIREVIELLDTGKLRVAGIIGEGWQDNGRGLEAVVMYFPI
jgi:2,3,4,5-tetrahydropyridine-2-carboxylate N-succinyltransferase